MFLTENNVLKSRALQNAGTVLWIFKAFEVSKIRF